MPEYTVRAIAFRRRGWWIAQCLDYSLATQTKTLEDLPTELHRLLSIQVAASLARGVEPFAGFLPAPRRYWEMYERAKARVEAVAMAAASDEVVRTETPRIKMVPGTGIGTTSKMMP